MTADLEALAAGASGSAQINYSSAIATTDYSVKTQGKNGVALDDISGGRTAAGNYRQLMHYLDGKLDNINATMAKIGAFTGRWISKKTRFPPLRSTLRHLSTVS